MIPNPRVAAVSHMLWYKVGAIDEEPGKSGIAHFLEHLMFRGTENLQPGEFSSLIANFGGNDNAFTTQDNTTYFQNIARENLALAMMLEADRMTGLQLDEELVTRERDVVLEERSSRIDNKPRNKLTEQMRAALYLNHPYNKPTIGWRHEIEQFTLHDTGAFYRKYYAPNNAVLIVAGDITAEELRPLAERYYGNIPAQDTPPREIPMEPQPSAFREVTVQDEKVREPEWIRMYLAPSSTYGKSEHALPLVLLAEVLGGSETGRLYQSLVVEKKLALQAYAYYDDISLGPTSFTLYVVPAKDVDFARVEAAVKQELKAILDEGVTNKELQRAQKKLKAEAIYAQDGLQNMAHIYGRVLVSGLDTSYIENWPVMVDNVTSAQITAAAEYIFKPERSVTGKLYPE